MRYTLEEVQRDMSLPEWMTYPECPSWARDSRYIDIDPLTGYEIRRGLVDQATVNARLRLRRHRAKRPAAKRPVDRTLAKLKGNVSLCRNRIDKAEAAAPGSMEAMTALLTLPSLQTHLAHAEAALSAYVEGALRKELARDE